MPSKYRIGDLHVIEVVQQCGPGFAPDYLYPDWDEAEAGQAMIVESDATISLGLVINAVHAIGLEAARGMYLTESRYWNRNELPRVFAARFVKAQSKMTNMVQAGLYSGVTHWLKAVAATGGGTEVVRAAMQATPVEDALIRGGIVRPDGLMAHDMLLLQVKNPAESRAAWDYMKVVRTVPGEQAFASLDVSRCAGITKR